MCLPHVFSIFKKISPITFGPHCVWLVDALCKADMSANYTQNNLPFTPLVYSDYFGEAETCS
jgi:hypothetical protein